jgi:protocatechuate 3,4-dioxygenase beta subunit
VAGAGLRVRRAGSAGRLRSIDPDVTRRRLLGLLAVAPVAVAAACSSDSSDTSDAGGQADDGAPAQRGDGALEPTPACGDDPTVSQTEGPFFSAGTPERSRLREPGLDGTPFVVEGSVVTTACAAIDRARIEFWHADDDGEYDTEGYRLRGHLFTDEVGGFRLETIVPGLYEGRTRHIHAIVQPRDGEPLTTQLYFPDEPGNADDEIFDPRLVMAVGEENDGSRRGAFTFVLDVN